MLCKIQCLLRCVEVGFILAPDHLSQFHEPWFAFQGGNQCKRAALFDLLAKAVMLVTKGGQLGAGE